MAFRFHREPDLTEPSNEFDGWYIKPAQAGCSLANSLTRLGAFRISARAIHSRAMCLPPLPPDIEIRHTPLAMGRLIFRPEDKKLRRFVLVTGQDGVYVVVGWDYGNP